MEAIAGPDNNRGFGPLMPPSPPNHFRRGGWEFFAASGGLESSAREDGALPFSSARGLSTLEGFDPWDRLCVNRLLLVRGLQASGKTMFGVATVLQRLRAEPPQGVGKDDSRDGER